MGNARAGRGWVVLLAAAALSMQVSARAGTALFEGSRAEVQRFEQDLSSAIGRNDVSALEHFLADDWTIVSGDGSVISRSTFLKVMASGDLVHQSMNPQDQTIRIYGHWAIVTAHIQSGGSYKGQPFHTDEIGTDVLLKSHGRWACVLTQLTTVALR